MSEIKIKRALIAVYDKTGIADFARTLADEFGIEIISTGGTARHLMEAGVPVTMVEDVTGFPELLDGRVKTLHPKIHAAILADRDNSEHMRQLSEHGIKPIDMVVVNLYPFEETIAKPNCSFEDAIEMIDIGGPCMLRAAAKNHRHVVVLSTAIEYGDTVRQLRCTSFDDPSERIRRADNAFRTTTMYDAEVAEWLSRRLTKMAGWPSFQSILAKNWGALRYGENPHQSAELWQIEDDSDAPDLTVSDAQHETGRSNSVNLSFNNFVDANAAVALCAELSRVDVKLWHRFSTGVSRQRHVDEQISEERFTRRNLPHIQKPEATYFLTFRLRKGELEPSERDIVMSSCRHWHGAKLTLHAVVVMPDHVHMLLTPHEIERDRWVPLGEIVHSVKRFSAREINKLRGKQGTLWQDETFDRVLRDEQEFIEKREYMEANPVTAGLPGASTYPWFWSSDTGFGETLDHRLQTGATGQGPPAVVFVKHTNACGVGVASDPIEAYRRAYLGDPNAAMGGILCVNFEVDASLAQAVMDSLSRWGKSAGAGAFFIEVWVAPSFDDAAVETIRTRKPWGERVRLLDVSGMTNPPDEQAWDIKRVSGGLLKQSADRPGLNEDQWKVVTKRSPTESEMSDLRLSWLIAKHTKSNAISICKDGMLIGNGAGQMSRIMSCRIATWLARENGHAEALSGSVAASDAFFPFRDGPDILADAGVTALIQPGGSKRDEDTIVACDERGLAMIFTGTRHFKH